MNNLELFADLTNQYVEFLDGKMKYKSSRCWNVYVGIVFEAFVEHEILDLHDEE